MKSTAFALIACVAVSPLSAQTWQGNTEDNGALIHGSVRAPEYSAVFTCNTPSQGGLSPLYTDDTHTISSEPFGMVFVLSYNLITAQGFEDRLDNVTVQTTAATYRMPPVQWNEPGGYWFATLPMTDPLFDALRSTDILIIDAGRGTAWRYPVDGLAQGLDTAMAACVAGWEAEGQSVPEQLARFQGAAIPPRNPRAATIPPTIYEDASEGCFSGRPALTRDDLTSADFDGDGAEDFILNHRVIDCNPGMSGFCGAANCSINVFLSSRAYQDPARMLGITSEIVTVADGRSGLQIGGSMSLCGGTGRCPGPVFWNGERFALP